MISLLLRVSLAILIVVGLGALFVGCSTLNEYGIGGDPVLMCQYRDGAAYIDDKLAGSADVHGSMVRRFKDVDVLCAKGQAQQGTPPAAPTSSALGLQRP